MHTVRKLIYSSVIKHVFGVTLAFSALFFFIDFVDEIRKYSATDSLITCLYMQGQHFYDIFPIGLLIWIAFMLFFFVVPMLAGRGRRRRYRSRGKGPWGSRGRDMSDTARDIILWEVGSAVARGMGVDLHEQRKVVQHRRHRGGQPVRRRRRITCVGARA